MGQDKIVVQIVDSFGFTEAMAKLYVAGLILGPALMMPLAKKAGIKRTTAYYVMEELLRRGFFHRIKIGKRMGYAAASSQELVEMVKQRELYTQRLLPVLKKLVRRK